MGEDTTGMKESYTYTPGNELDFFSFSKEADNNITHKVPPPPSWLRASSVNLTEACQRNVRGAYLSNVTYLEAYMLTH